MILPTRDRPPATARKLTAFAATLVTWDNLGSYIFAEHTKPPPQRPLATLAWPPRTTRSHRETSLSAIQESGASVLRRRQALAPSWATWSGITTVPRLGRRARAVGGQSSMASATLILRLRLSMVTLDSALR